MRRSPATTTPDLPAGTLETDAVAVRALRAEDLATIVRIDARIVGRPRSTYYELRIAEALRETGVRVSLVAEQDGAVVGFLLARVFYGEFGRPEPSAVLDTLGVDPDFRGRHVGAALLRQFEMACRALGIESLETQVDWAQGELLRFLHARGFALAPRLCLTRRLDGADA